MPASDVFTFMVKMRGFRDLAVPPRGNIDPMEALARAIRVNGDVWTNCPAKRILIKGNEARAVVVQRDGGEVEIPSRLVISDIGPKIMVELAGEENFGEEYLRLMRLKLQAVPVTMCFVASDRPLWPEDGSPAMLMLVGARRLHSVVPLSNISPELAPPGQHLMFATGRPVSVRVRMNPEVEQEQIRLDLKEQFPLYEKHGRILKMVSKDITDELPEARAIVGLGMPVETPVRNLFEVSDATPALGYTGAIGCMESVKRVAEIIRKRFKPRQG
jgi:phytoene dehydrogenase-like protein